MSDSKSSSWWTVGYEVMVDVAIANSLPEEQRASFWNNLKGPPGTSRNLQEHLQCISSLGHQFDEPQLFQKVLDYWEAEESSEKFLLWLVSEFLPRSETSAERVDILDSSIRKLSGRISKLAEDRKWRSVPIDNQECHVSDAEEGIRRLCNALTAQKCLLASQNDAGNFNRNLQISMEPCFKNLVSRVESLEQMVKENREGMELYQPVTQGEELTARAQALENKIKELQPPFSMLSDAAESSTCTLTPASTVVNDSNDDVAGVRHAGAATAAPLRLRVAVYDSLPGCSNSVSRLTQKVLVKMYPHTPFRFLTDKLAEKFGDHQLSSSHSGQSIFDSETPKSLGLGDSAELTYSNTVGSKTIDLTVM
ncbi:hypothetical protein D6D21_09811 [Aureobasidium pullulans]|uniref:Uncharacterized protein n=1 Tax=Aureobasidium pullulans TaxID=5580 RepID=A0AB74IK78_AURPU|nr:hypothetical protein D6D21_09811 [Aureobasidium pullulans]